MKKFLLVVLALLPVIALADYDARSAFLTAPRGVLGYVDATSRLDMIDYKEAGMADRTVTNSRRGESKLTELTDSTFTLKNGEVQTYSAHLLCGKSDTLIAVIETLLTPAPDSRLTVYNRQWQPIQKAWKAPDSKIWGKHDAKFLLTEYKLEGDTLTLTDRTSDWDSAGAPTVKSIRYVWNRKANKFVRLK